jgi:pilus assembly protein CpaB
VDVLLTGNPSRNNDPRTISTTTVLQNIVVLAAGTKLQRTPDGQPQNVPVITLLVSPDDAQKLTLASSEGKIQLALRNPLDADAEPPAVLRNAALYHEGSPTATKRATRRKQGAPPSAPVYVVEMIRGDKRDAASFEEK